jgi:hypothetical protein
MSSTKGLTDQARFLRNAAPQAYDKFLAAFAEYAAQMTNNLIETTEHLPVAQGHAQLAMKVLRALEAARV